MSSEINRELFTNVFYSVIEESFNNVEGVYLDKGTSLFATIDTLSAAEVSRTVPGGTTTIAGHVDHVGFYLWAIENFMTGRQQGKLDWSESWKTRVVNDDEWAAVKKRCREAQESVLAVMKGFDDWNDEKKLGGALGVLAHTAFHLGAIRQMVIATKESRGGRANLGEFETM